MPDSSPTIQTRHLISLVPGDGIGEEITAAVLKIFEAAKVPVAFELLPSPTQEADALTLIRESVRKNQVLLKGPLATPIGGGHTSLNLILRKELGLFANVRPFLTFAGVKSRYEGIDLIVVRENTEGEYCGLEHEIVPGVVEALKIITREASSRVAQFTLALAASKQRKKVTAVHKANIMKKSDGLFLECCREAARQFPSIEYTEIIVDNCCMQLVLDPLQFDVLLLPNLYGDIVSELCAGLVGGLGLAPSANNGQNCAMFEAVHGSAPDLAGKGLANPTAIILSGVLLLRHINLLEYADRIEKAVRQTLSSGKCLTRDLGGTATTTEYTDALIRAINNPRKIPSCREPRTEHLPGPHFGNTVG